jgi:hypothetical protein
VAAVVAVGVVDVVGDDGATDVGPVPDGPTLDGKSDDGTALDEPLCAPLLCFEVHAVRASRLPTNAAAVIVGRLVMVPVCPRNHEKLMPWRTGCVSCAWAISADRPLRAW